MAKKRFTKVPDGLQLTYKGYYRVTRSGIHQWKLLHRRVMEQQLERTHPLTLAVLKIHLNSRGKLDSLPEAWDAHHIDGNKLHNCPQNLMLLDHALHGALFVGGIRQ
jgi:hypothetical protein